MSVFNSCCLRRLLALTKLQYSLLRIAPVVWGLIIIFSSGSKHGRRTAAFIDADRCVWRTINAVIDSCVVRSQCDAAAVSISHAHLQFAAVIVDALYSTSQPSFSASHAARISCCCCCTLLRYSNYCISLAGSANWIHRKYNLILQRIEIW